MTRREAGEGSGKEVTGADIRGKERSNASNGRQGKEWERWYL